MLLAVAAAWAAPALAQDAPDALRFCPDRPSLASSGCTTDPGHLQVEFSALDWQRDDQPDAREDRIVVADLLGRVGVTPTTEVQVAWTAFGHVRTRDRTTGLVERDSGAGDVMLAIRQNLRDPGGDGLSFAVQPYVSLPVGHQPIGDTTWSAGALLPATYGLSDKLQLAFTGEIDAAADADDHRRHLAYSGIGGLGYKLTDQVTANAELELARDDDPSGHETQALAAGSVAWQPRHRLQLDLLAVAGLNRAAPDVRLVAGGAVLF